MALVPGARLGPYEITTYLGSGGMGDLYGAIDTRLNRTVAIKLLRADVAHDDAARRRLDREARAIGALAHPHICVLYDVGEHDGDSFLVLEHLQGETLAKRLAEGPLPTEEAVRFAHQIAQALDAAHRQGVLHRDLNPNNVMITRSGVKLLDFGIAALRPETLPNHTDSTVKTATVDATQTVTGTAPYMAPERIEGRPGDARTDIFAFGAVFFEMLTGRRAFTGNSPAAVLAAIMNTPPKLDERLPAELNRIIQRCLARDPEDRWQSARDLAEALTLIADRPLAAPVIEAPARGRRWLIAALTGVVLATILIGFFWRRQTPATALPVVVLMDSTLPERVYDPRTRADGGTNSDDITDALRDLPLEIHKETTSASWRREDQVLRQKPSLVIMHLSSFAHPQQGPGAIQPEAVERTRSFMGFIGLGNSGTRFIVYTRGYATSDQRDAWVAETEQRFPALKGRVQMLHVPGGDEAATFRDPATRQLVRERVLTTLGLKPQ